MRDSLCSLSAPGTLAAHEDGIENDPFTPQFSFSTTTDRAGAHPNLSIEMQKEFPNHCIEPEAPTRSNRCTLQYIEENLKQMTVSFPPGAIPDPNAAPYCNVKSRGIYPGENSEVFGCENDVPVGVVDITAQLCVEEGGASTKTPDGCSAGFLNGNPFGEGVCNDPQIPPNEGWTYYSFFGPPDETRPGYTYICRSLGYVYNEEPRTDESGGRVEDGHLVILWPRWLDQENVPPAGYPPPELFDPIGGYVTVKPTHVSVKVRPSDLGVDSIAEVPDFLPGNAGYVQPGQPSDLSLTLFGATGTERRPSAYHQPDILRAANARCRIPGLCPQLY